MTSTDRWLRTYYLARFWFALRECPRPEYRKIAREIRAQLDTADISVEPRSAMGALGSPRRLAYRYLAELPRLRPRWIDGHLMAIVVVVVLPCTAVYLYGLGATDVLVTTQTEAVVDMSFMSFYLTVIATPDHVGVAFPMPLIDAAVSALAYLPVLAVGARIWRLWR